MVMEAIPIRISRESSCQIGRPSFLVGEKRDMGVENKRHLQFQVN